MNKLLTKIAGVALGLSLAIGVGVSASKQTVREAKATDYSLVASYSFENTKNTTAVTDSATIVGWFHLNSGTNIVSSASNATKVYPGANGGSGTNAWSTDNALKIGSASAYGEITLGFAANTTIDKVAVTAYGWKANHKLTVGGVSETNAFVLANKTNVTGNAANEVEFELATSATTSLTFSTNDATTPTAVVITAISFYKIENAAAITPSEVEALISAIGTVEYTDECKTKIQVARAKADAYNNQDGCQYVDISNYSVLTAAEAAYETAENNALANNVISLINAIGTVVYTPECQAKISAARTAYDALTDDQKALVTNYAVLTAAEARYEELRPLEVSYVFSNKALEYADNGYGGVWSASTDANSFESASPSRGLQFGAAIGEATLTLDISGVTTFNGYTMKSVTLVASTNGDAGKNSIGVSVGETAYTKDDETSYSMPKQNNMSIVFEGSSDAGNVVISFNDAHKSVYIKSVTIALEENKTITSSRMTAGTVSASTGDTKWTLAGFVFEVQYSGESTWHEVSATYSVNLAVPTIDDDGTLAVVVTGSYKDQEKQANVTAILTFVNIHTIESVYSGAANDTFEVDGIYMGEVPNGYIFMNGEYGILVYDKSHGATVAVGGAYTIQGTLKIYSGLYELDNETITELPNGSRKNHIATPETYTVVGGETADKANRKTSFSGVVTAMTSTATGSDSTVTVNVGGNNVQVFVKGAVATETVMAALEASKDNETSIIIEGYTSWYNGFQVSLTNVVIEDTSYTVYQFARSLLKLTSGTCNESYDGVTNNGAALESIWDTLSGASYYGKLTEARKNDLKTATADSAVVVPVTDEAIDAMSDADALKAAMYRYDYCTAKYNLTEFIEGRTLTVHFDANLKANVEIDSTNVPFVLVIISLVSVTAIAGCIILRKKRHY